ncbi:hypothetical protein [Wocania ichthyoenteri]|uniref:hypothetical protein n=1 Tax=Wocania ichthyoenteri TaxID=1230531 RepID=UPI00053EB9E7|nr:hypothetical protein [Wocania ichthyoenteri]
MKFLKLFGHLTIILILTVLTQVGGLVWLLALFISIKLKKKKRFTFPILYLVFNVLIIPPIAKPFGREQLPIFNDYLKPRNWVYPLFFRNYVTSDLKALLENSATNLKPLNISITYLDANFPFKDGFPLMPHLSHNDGKKIDISFMYLDKHGKSSTKKPSVSGYGAFVDSNNISSENCLNKGYWQYDFTKYMTFGIINNLKLDKPKTKLLIKELLDSNLTEKIFIEPYLKESLKLINETKIRFHGCQAVRHDDHIHLQIK